MVRIANIVMVVAGTVALAGCGDSGSTPPTNTGGNSAAQRAADDLRAAAATMKAAATEAASAAQPALEKAKEESRQVIHDAAQKIADRTATAPTTQQ